MTRHALSFGFGLLALLSLDAVAAPAASTAAPPETVAPSASSAVGNATTIPLAPNASTAASPPEAAPATVTQSSAAPAASTQAAPSTQASPAPPASTAAPATVAPAPAPAATAAPVAVPVTRASNGPTKLPVRGMNMDNVEHIFGTPLEKHGAVGKPPITRWDYADYVVYFEYNLVLHTVMKSAPFSESAPPG